MFHVFKTIIPLSEFFYNHMQNILRKIKKLNKFTQIRKTFVSVFECQSQKFITPVEAGS